jgi:hypothetical protein
VHVTVAGTAESLTGINLALLHLGRVIILHNRHALATVNLPLANVVSVQVPDWLDWERLLTNGDLVTLHDLLNDLANVAHPYVNAGSLDTGIR